LTEITRRTDYAIRMLVELARLPKGERLSTKRLCDLQGVPYPFARRIMTDLSTTGLVATRRGSGGGAVLARPAAAITLLDVITLLGDDISLSACAHDESACRYAEGCEVRHVWRAAEATLARYLGSQDFATLAATVPASGRSADERRPLP